jgi:F0F1-type ATP synthase membrane subunit b/b'
MVLSDLENKEQQERARVKKLEYADSYLHNAQEEVKRLRKLADAYVERAIETATERSQEICDEMISNCKTQVQHERKNLKEKVDNLLDAVYKNYKQDVYNASVKITKQVLKTHMLSADKERVLEDLLNKL